MIPAALSCPRCMRTILATERGNKAGKNWKHLGHSYWFFVCPCGQAGFGHRDITEAHFTFLVRIGHLRPDGSVLYRHGVEEGTSPGPAEVLPLRSKARSRQSRRRMLPMPGQRRPA